MIVVDTDAMERLHIQWMDLPGPRRMSSRMDELRPPAKDEDEPPQGTARRHRALPEVATKQGTETHAAPGRGAQLLTVHGVLHLAGYDHEEPDEKAEMFGSQAAIVDGWRAEKGPDRPVPGPDRLMSLPLIAGAVALVVIAWLAACARRRGSPGSPASAPRRPYGPAARRQKLAKVAADPTRYLNVALLVRVACEWRPPHWSRTPVRSSSTAPARRW